MGLGDGRCTPSGPGCDPSDGAGGSSDVAVAVAEVRSSWMDE